MQEATQQHDSPNEPWPSIPWDAWQDTCRTLHRLTQIAGKIRLELSPMINHWWQVPLYVDSRGLTTSPIPYEAGIFDIHFDFLSSELRIATSGGAVRTIGLRPRTVAAYYREIMDALESLGIAVAIWTTPVEVDDRTPFENDTAHAAYDAEQVRRFWKALVQADRVIKGFQSGFLGKISPVHFFWGSFDLAATRFSGRRAPTHPGAPGVGRFVTVEAYSHEVSSCGFFPGSGLGTPAFYSYAYPEPEGYREYPVQPKEAYYHGNFREFILPYDAIRTAASPDETLLSFLRSTYEAAADLAKWDRKSLERDPAELRRLLRHRIAPARIGKER